ncbi:hypothetical protein VOLCADRAFT_100158 [Volvox carteri f. nagariensis]|uniref:PHD-type domain-containing protein n=1 Tax=Volvox carteri f. nagariensis TaxID=3068 RepID=D8UJJ8_VOLCA|nr:uncharacterized protein VOLCADRAFT_100158 [Volvox carteri f. nagariensis]EFJ40096.1 hypothetical protein VOLCADRAFT_100158 [Volvox carteri f. nagariensis]|eukprot:XP_002958845.1 hypothetical protein VOLCADRAFT_100158 [Volvox carteri f. nagariensis]
MKREDRLEKPRGAEVLCSKVMNEPWYDREPDAPEFIDVSPQKIKPHLSQDVKLGGSMMVYVQPPGKEAGGRDCAAMEAKYEVLEKPGPKGEPLGRVNVANIRNYMVSSRKYKAEVLSGDTVELWPTTKANYFMMGLIKEVCWVCEKETGDPGNGLAYICEGCNKSVHAKCAGLRRELREDEDFFCRRCRPTVAEDVIGEEDEEEGEEDEDEEEGEEEEEFATTGKSRGTGRGKDAVKGGNKGKKRKAAKGVEGDIANPKAIKRRNKTSS